MFVFVCMYVLCVLTSASFCSRIWSLSTTSSSTALQRNKTHSFEKKLEKEELNCCLSKINQHLTCRLSSVSLSGSSHSADPELPPGGLACGSCNKHTCKPFFTHWEAAELHRKLHLWWTFTASSLRKTFCHVFEDFPSEKSDYLSSFISRETHTSMVRSLRKSLCSGFSTSTTPQG